MNHENVAKSNQTMQALAADSSGILQRKCVCGQHVLSDGNCQNCEAKKVNIQRKTTNLSEQSEVLSGVQKEQQLSGFLLDAEFRKSQEPSFMVDFSRIQSGDSRRGKENNRFRLQFASRSPTEEFLAVPEVVHDVLRNSGRPLDFEIRKEMESRFNYDFDSVRIHSNAKASESALASNAVAYTVNRNIVFGPGQYAPQTVTGKKLLAHELTHVVQQGLNTSTASRPLQIGHVDSSAEREADVIANNIVTGSSPVQVTAAASAQVLWPWRGSFDITNRLPESRKFSVTSGNVIVESSARWDNPAACPASSSYQIRLWEEIDYWPDTSHGSNSYPVPGTATHTWSSLPSGTYYLEIDWGNTNPNCRILGDINVTT